MEVLHRGFAMGVRGIVGVKNREEVTRGPCVRAPCRRSDRFTTHSSDVFTYYGWCNNNLLPATTVSIVIVTKQVQGVRIGQIHPAANGCFQFVLDLGRFFLDH